MYNYKTEKVRLFTEDGQEMFLAIRDNIKELLSRAGAFKMGCSDRGITGDSWQMMACVDRLVELGELKEITGPNVAGQDRVFVKVGD